MTAIFWDWNGTLLDDTQAALATLNTMLERRGKATVSMRDYRDHFAFPVRPFYNAIGLDVPDAQWDALAREYHETYATMPKALNVHAREALERVRKSGARQYIVSALRQDLLNADLAHYGIADAFTFAYGTDNLNGASKLTCARDLMTRLGHPNGKSVCLIGDAFHDKDVADTLGIGCVLHGEGSHAPWRLRTRGPYADTIMDAVRLALSQDQ